MNCQNIRAGAIPAGVQDLERIKAESGSNQHRSGNASIDNGQQSMLTVQEPSVFADRNTLMGKHELTTPELILKALNVHLRDRAVCCVCLKELLCPFRRDVLNFAVHGKIAGNLGRFVMVAWPRPGAGVVVATRAPHERIISPSMPNRSHPPAHPGNATTETSAPGRSSPTQ